MRVKNMALGAVVLASLMLTGCSVTFEDVTKDAMKDFKINPEATGQPKSDGSKKPSSDETSDPWSDDSDNTDSGSSGGFGSASGDCPELKEGVKIDSFEISSCSRATLEKAAGYATTSESDLGFGKSTTTKTRSNPGSKEYESISDGGSYVIIGDDSWVKTSSGSWQVADENSSDPSVSLLSLSASLASSAGGMSAFTFMVSDFTVTGTSNRMGTKVYVLEGSSDNSGTKTTSKIEVTADYAILAGEMNQKANSYETSSKAEVTEWNKKQDIKKPM